MTEINPNNKTVQLLREQWYKIVALLLHKFNLGTVEITCEDINALEIAFPGGMPAVLADTRNGKFTVKLVSEEEGRRLASAN